MSPCQRLSVPFQLTECLAQLITDNLEVSRWVFKLDDEFDGRGIAYCDVTENLKCHQWATKEAQRYGDKWKKKWAQVGGRGMRGGLWGPGRGGGGKRGKGE